MQQLPPRDEGQKKSVEAKCGINKWLKVWTWQTVQAAGLERALLDQHKTTSVEYLGCKNALLGWAGL